MNTFTAFQSRHVWEPFLAKQNANFGIFLQPKIGDQGQ